MAQEDVQTDRTLIDAGTGFDQLDRLARELGWPLESVTEPDRQALADGQAIWSMTGLGSLHYIEDALSGEGYFVLRGHDRQELESVRARIAALVDSPGLQELKADVDRAPDSDALTTAVLRLALGAPEDPDPAVRTRIERALVDADERVRYFAVWASTYTGDRGLLPAIRRLAADDPSDMVRERAADVARAFDDEYRGEDS